MVTAPRACPHKQTTQVFDALDASWTRSDFYLRALGYMQRVHVAKPGEDVIVPTKMGLGSMVRTYLAMHAVLGECFRRQGSESVVWVIPDGGPHPVLVGTTPGPLGPSVARASSHGQSRFSLQVFCT